MAEIEGAEIDDAIQLWDPEDHSSARQRIFDGVKEELASTFPASYGGVRVEVDDLDYEGDDKWDKEQQSQAKLYNKYLARKLRGTVRLVDEKTNEVLDEKKLSLLRVPYLTERGTFIHGGSEYTATTQARLLSGPYTRRQENGGLETVFNPRPGTGRAFRVALEPDTGQFRLRVQTANLHLYSLLKDIGYTDEQLEKRWGPELLAANAKKYDSRVFDKAYEKMVGLMDRQLDADRSAKVTALRTAFDRFQMNEEVARRNLPNMFDQTKAASWAMEHAARVLGNEVAARHAAVNDFLPDVPPDQAGQDLWWWEDWDPGAKQASVAEAPDFEPDLDADDMQEAYQAIYGKAGPQLASMKSWPSKWFPAGTDQLGWINWYRDYANGSRTDDDARQIDRWKRFKARHGAQFRTNPTPRRAFALRNWAIDPLKLLDRPDDRKAMADEMEAYRQRETSKWLAKRASFGRDTLMGIATFLNREHNAGLNLQASASELEQQVMAFLTGQGVDGGLASFADDQLTQAHTDLQQLYKQADEKPLQALMRAKEYSDQRRYGDKQAILAGLMRDQPDEFMVDSRDGDIVGITHLPTNFRIHVPIRHVPASIMTRKVSKEDAIPRRPILTKDESKPQRRAVIIKGNPFYVDQNPAYDAFYEDVKQQLEKHNYQVDFDKGEPHTLPSTDVDVWVAHSRGGDRLRFAPDHIKTLLLDEFEDGYQEREEQMKQRIREAGYSSVAEWPVEQRPVPGPEHYTLSDSAREAIDSLTETKQAADRYDRQAARRAKFYHGSGVEGLTELQPSASKVLDGEAAVFMSRDPDYALTFAAPWRDDDFEHGHVDGQFYMRERRPGAYEEIFRRPGHVYHLAPGEDDVEQDSRLTRLERIVRKAVPVARVDSYTDILEELLKRESILMLKHGDEAPWEVLEKRAVVEQRGDGWVLLTKDLSRVLGTHPTAQAAYRQEYAIQKAEERRVKEAKLRPIEERLERLDARRGVYEKRREEARQWTEEPISKAQADAGNYRKGTFSMRGLRFTIETAKGSKRRGWDADGNPTWEVTLEDDYGYVLGTESDRDGDHLDVFLGPDLSSEVIYCVDQIKQDEKDLSKYQKSSTVSDALRTTRPPLHPGISDLAGDEGEMHQSETQTLPLLRGQGNSGLQAVAQELSGLLGGHGGTPKSGAHLGPEEYERELLPRKLPVGFLGDSAAEQTEQPQISFPRGTKGRQRNSEDDGPQGRHITSTVGGAQLDHRESHFNALDGSKAASATYFSGSQPGGAGLGDGAGDTLQPDQGALTGGYGNRGSVDNTTSRRQKKAKAGDFCEHKFIVGARSEKEAREIYLRNFSKGWKCGRITPLTWPQFRRWCMVGDTSKSMEDTSSIDLPVGPK